MSEIDTLTALVIKHLPPSAAVLMLRDIGGVLHAALTARRPDIHHAPHADALDAVVGLFGAPAQALQPDLLAESLAALRPGGRMVLLCREGSLDEAHGRALEAAGFARILVEEVPLDTVTVLLLRGERPHLTADTLARVQGTAAQDADLIDPAAYRGRCLHLLVIQTPNRPAWADAAAPVTWQAACADGALLAFSSLPKAVAFMQAAVLANQLSGVNKMPCFSRDRAAEWPLPARLNPPADVLHGAVLTWASVDPLSAEAPDE